MNDWGNKLVTILAYPDKSVITQIYQTLPGLAKNTAPRHPSIRSGQAPANLVYCQAVSRKREQD
jgi:hypothetical protein